MSEKIKFERMKEMPKLKQEIISYLFDHVARKPQGRWWQYKGEFVFEKKRYDLECECKYDNQMFTYRNLHIQHKMIVVDAEQCAETGIIH